MVKKQRLRIVIILFVITLVIVALRGLVPKSKAKETTEIQITYNSGEGTGKNIVITKKIPSDTNRKIVLNRNVDFEGGTTEIDGHTYQKVLIGWKITELTQGGKKITNDLNTVYAQDGWYNVPKGVTSIEITAVYGRAIYIRSPYDKMYYDEYHIFTSGENAGNSDEQEEKSSDENYGTSQQDAVATLKRAYELIGENANNTVYDTVFVLCGDLYEINYKTEGKDFTVDNKGTYKNYSSDSLGYQKGYNKPVTITSDNEKKYSLYMGAQDEGINIYSSLRFDNINIKSLSEENISDIHGTEVTTKTYLNLADLCFFSTGIFEVTETVGTEDEEMNVLYGNLSSVILNSGSWNPLVAKDSKIISELSKNNYVQIGGNANISTLKIDFKNPSETDAIVNPPIIKVTGGKINELIGTENANLMFVNFESETDETKYKAISKIQNWENVFLENSYLIINDVFQETKNITVPDGSGLKLSKDEEINGNFNGGGELYLDSNICLTINGDIKGITKLILTPSIVNGKNIIIGGINHPYLKVKGSSIAKTQSQSSDEVVSGESKYEILSQKSDYSYYYIQNDVEISNFVEIKSTNAIDKIYTDSLGTSVGSNASDISILEIGDYTQDIELNYEFYKNSTNANKYANISRQFVLKTDKQTNAIIPNGTEILMIYNDKKYNYVVSGDVESVDLSLFKDEDGNTFKQVSNLQLADGVTKETNGVTGDTLYNYSESFRFIVSFANIINNKSSINAGTYYSIVNILDSDSWINSEQIEDTNKINISQVVFTPNNINTELEKYEPNGDITIKSAGTVKTYGGNGKQLYGNIKIYKNVNGNKCEQVDIPVGSKISLNNQDCMIVNGTTQCKFVDNCTDAGTSYNFNFELNMKNVLEQNQLQTGAYKIVFSYAFAQDDLINGNVAGWLDVPLIIVNYSNNYGLDVKIENSENLADDKLQLISKGTETIRNIVVSYSGELEEPYIKTVIVEKINDFEYDSTDNSKKITVKDGSNGKYEVDFSNSIDVGTYRIIFVVYDKYGNKKTENFVNFIVADTPQM